MFVVVNVPLGFLFIIIINLYMDSSISLSNLDVSN